MSFIKSLLFSIFIYAIAVSIYANDNVSSSLILIMLSAAVLLFSSFILCYDIQGLHILGSVRNYSPMVVMSSLSGLGIGLENYIYYSLGFFFFVIALHTIISKSFSSDSIASQLFKLSLLLLLFSFIYIKLLWLLPFLLIMILYFRGPIIMDILALISSVLSLALIVLWCNWYFELNLIDDVSRLFSVNDFFMPLKFDSAMSNLSLGLLAVLSIVSVIARIDKLNQREINDNLSSRFVSFIYLILFIVLLAILTLGGELKPDCVIWLAVPFSAILPVYYCKIRSPKSRRILLSVFVFLILVSMVVNYMNLSILPFTI